MVGVIIFGDREVDVREIHTSDTVFIYKTDTIFEEKPVVKYKMVVDTMYVEKYGKIFEFPVESKRYSKSGVYDAWVSGFKPSLDSIKTYNKTEYRTITERIKTEVYPKQWNIYGECGFYSFSDRMSPALGISIISPRKLKIGANFGYCEGLTYGLTIGVKLN